MKTILILSVLLFSFFTYSQAPSWVWAKSGSSLNNDEGTAIDHDSEGNIYMVGQFYLNVTFGSISLNSNGYDDMFIVKYSPSGNVIWAKNFGGSIGEKATCISIDNNDNVFVGGYFNSSSISFDGFTVNESPSNSSSDIFLIKLSTNGNVQWAKGFGGNNGDSPQEIATDANGNIFMTGGFDSNSVSFGSFTLTSLGAGHTVVYVVKFNPQGNPIWGKTAGGSTSTDIGYGITTDPNDNVIITGTYNSPTITFGNITLTSIGATNCFLTKYDNSGNVIWAKSFGGEAFDYSLKIQTDMNSNIYLAGNFFSFLCTFGNESISNSNTAEHKADVFVAKYDANGNSLWAKSAGGLMNDMGVNLTLDNNGGVYITGWFTSSSITFGNTTLNKFSPGTYNDIFIAKFDDFGNNLWAMSEGCNSFIQPYDIMSNATGELFITGYFQCDTMHLGSNELINSSFNNESYLGKINNILGIDEINENESFNIAPNPFDKETTINFYEEQNNLNIKIIDLLGNVAFNTVFSGKNLIIEKGKMKPGIYIIQTSNATKTNKKRIVIN